VQLLQRRGAVKPQTGGEAAADTDSAEQRSWSASREEGRGRAVDARLRQVQGLVDKGVAPEVLPADPTYSDSLLDHPLYTPALRFAFNDNAAALDVRRRVSRWRSSRPCV
jgi:hypothetical protein